MPLYHAANRCTVSEEYVDGKHVYLFTGPYSDGTPGTRTVRVPAEELNAYNRGGLIQNTLKSVSVDDREFLMTGTSPEGWDKAFGPDPADEEYGLGADDNHFGASDNR